MLQQPLCGRNIGGGRSVEVRVGTDPHVPHLVAQRVMHCRSTPLNSKQAQARQDRQLSEARGWARGYARDSSTRSPSAEGTHGGFGAAGLCLRNLPCGSFSRLVCLPPQALSLCLEVESAAVGGASGCIAIIHHHLERHHSHSSSDHFSQTHRNCGPQQAAGSLDVLVLCYTSSWGSAGRRQDLNPLSVCIMCL